MHQVLNSTRELTACGATHLTSFATGFVPQPNTLDFEFVFAAASFEDNLTIYLLLIIITFLYIVWMIWALWKDRKDEKKVVLTEICQICGKCVIFPLTRFLFLCWSTITQKIGISTSCW